MAEQEDQKDQEKQDKRPDRKSGKPEEKISSKETLPTDQELKDSQDLYISEEPLEKIEAEDVDVEEELAERHHYDTQRGEGHTHDPFLAQDQGLTYTPPTDPPTLPSEDAPEGIEVATGFAPSMESSDPDVERLPPHVDDSDLDLVDDVYLMLRNNSETGHLTNIKVQVHNGVVNLLGTVPSEDDIARVHAIVSEMDGVNAVQNNLQTR